MDRTTVDALKALGKALCGDSFEVTPGLTDAEMIFEIAKQYEAPEGGDGCIIQELIITCDANEDMHDPNQYIVTINKTEQELVTLGRSFTPSVIKLVATGFGDAPQFTDENVLHDGTYYSPIGTLYYESHAKTGDDEIYFTIDTNNAIDLKRTQDDHLNPMNAVVGFIEYYQIDFPD